MMSKAASDVLDEQLQNEKRFIWAPCGFVEWDKDRNRFAMTYPAVDCDLQCETCGWNPFVRKARIKRLMKQ